MDLTGSVQSWIQWSLDNLPRDGDIPPINWRGAGRPWEACGIELFDRADMEGCSEDYALLQAFERVLSRDPYDLAVRFTTLSVYYELSTFVPIYEEQFVAEDRRRHRKNLAYLVNMVVPEDCTDWRTIAWEVLNSYASRDCWDRALRLLARAEQLKLKDRREIQVIRGQLRFLEVFGEEMEVPLDSLEWEPRILEPNHKDSKVLAYHAVSAWLSKLQLSEEHVEKLKDASNDLDKGLGGGQQFASVYRALLAACHFWTERFLEAAKEYERLLNARLPTLDPEITKELTYLSAATSYRRGGRSDKAIECCQRCVLEFADNSVAHTLLAQSYEDATEYKAACRSYREAVRLNPKLGEEPGVRMALAIGEVWELTEAGKAKLRARPEYDQIKSVLMEYWPSFVRMGEVAIDEWIFGVLETHFCTVQGPIKDTYYRKANASFAQAVELELSSKVFAGFQEYGSADPELLSLAAQAVKEKNQESSLFAKFVLKQGDLGIGQMAYILDHCRNSRQTLFQEFARWVRLNHGRLLEQVPRLYDIAKFRNPALHKGISTNAIKNIPGWCREVIDSI